MLEPEELIQDIAASLVPKRLAGHKVLITAGPTFEAMDPVRGSTNHSSGKMGLCHCGGGRARRGRRSRWWPARCICLRPEVLSIPFVVRLF